MEGFEKVAQRGDIEAGKLTVVEVQGEAIVVTELAGSVIAFSNVCSHEDCDFVFEGPSRHIAKQGHFFVIHAGAPTAVQGALFCAIVPSETMRLESGNARPGAQHNAARSPDECK